MLYRINANAMQLIDFSANVFQLYSVEQSIANVSWTMFAIR